MAEKRIQKRIRKRLAVRFGTDDLCRVGFTEDISDEGLFLKSAVVFNPGTRLKVELTVPGGEIILLEGVVAWAKKIPPAMIRRLKGGMGIQILLFHHGDELFRLLCAEPESYE